MDADAHATCNAVTSGRATNHISVQTRAIDPQHAINDRGFAGISFIIMPTHDAILDVLRTIPDPEMPISIVDLGIVERVDIDGCRAAIDILPTFVGCPALSMIEEQVREKVQVLPGIETVDVQFIFDPPWTVDRITDAGRASLKEHGVTVPERGMKLHHPQTTIELRTSAIPCPFCESTRTRLDSPFGPTRCRMIYYCEQCKNSFEHLKRIAANP